MKNNKYQITGIKGRLLHFGFVTCYLLIVLLYACAGGYQPNVKGIKFYRVNSDDTKTLIDDNNPVILHKGTLNGDGKSDGELVILEITCVNPSSVSDEDISIRLSLDPEQLQLDSFDIGEDFSNEHYTIPDESGVYLSQIDFKNLSPFVIYPLKIRAMDIVGDTKITFTVNPDDSSRRLSFPCPVTVATYIVTFDKNGGATEAVPRQKAIINDGDTIDALPTQPEHSDITKTFDSWNTKADETGTTFDENTPVTADTIVFAIWK